MQISSPVFRHERWETTNRNRREAALTPPRLLQEKKKETRGWKYGVGFQPFGKYPQFDQKFIMWLLEQLGFPGGCCCTLYSSFNVVNTPHFVCVRLSVCSRVNAIWGSACVCVCVLAYTLMINAKKKLYFLISRQKVETGNQKVVVEFLIFRNFIFSFWWVLRIINNRFAN